MSIIARLTNISKFYGKNLVLENINLEIPAASITTIIGPNGAGKSTLARVLLNIENPTSGQLWRKKDLRIGYVPQKLTIDKNLPMQVASFLSIISQTNNVNEVLDLVNLKDKTQIQDLSGGEFQRLLLASALLNKPELLVLDEAIQGLDMANQQNFYKIITQVRDMYKTAIFMISHDLYTVMSKSDKVICLNKHICCKGAPASIIYEPEYIKIFGVSAYQHTNILEH